jgi:hypothetical protein
MQFVCTYGVLAWETLISVSDEILSAKCEASPLEHPPETVASGPSSQANYWQN